MLEKESVEDFEKRIKGAKLLSEYFIEKLTQTFEITSLEKKASLASKAMGHLASMQESSIKKLLESEVSKVTGLDINDLQTHSQSSVKNRKSLLIKKDLAETKEERVFQQTGLGSKIINVVLAYPFLATEIEDLERFDGFKEPEVKLMVEVVKYFITNPKLGISDLLSNIDQDSASFIGTLISTSPTIEEKNALAYLKDCVSLLKKTDSISRIIELKEIYTDKGLSDDETFELQQHLLSNIDKLEEPEKKLLRELSQKAN